MVSLTDVLMALCSVVELVIQMAHERVLSMVSSSVLLLALLRVDEWEYLIQWDVTKVEMWA